MQHQEMKKIKIVEVSITDKTESLLGLLCPSKVKNLTFGAFQRACFLKLEVITNQTMWEKNVKQKNMNGWASL